MLRCSPRTNTGETRGAETGKKPDLEGGRLPARAIYLLTTRIIERKRFVERVADFRTSTAITESDGHASIRRHRPRHRCHGQRHRLPSRAARTARSRTRAVRHPARSWLVTRRHAHHPARLLRTSLVLAALDARL